MPIKRKTYKKPGPKKTKRMRRYRRKTNLNSWYPFNASRTAKLRYCEQFIIDPGVSTIGNYVFAANGLYDPNTTGVGHQPYGFDQLMALYNEYTVLGAKITAYVVNPPSASVLAVKLSDTTALNTSDPMLLMEQPGLKKKMITHADQAEKTQITQSYSAYKFFRTNKTSIIANNQMKGSAISNPFNTAHFIVCYAPLVSGTDIGPTTLHVTIDYTAIFTGPKELVSS